MYGFSVQTAPTALPVLTAEAKKQCEIATGITYHDEQLLNLIGAATAEAEKRTGRQIMTATLDFILDDFPAGSGRITLPRPPLQSVTSITYTATDGTAETTLATSVYTVLTGQEPGQVALKYNQSWPDVYDEPQSVVVRYVAGYGSDPEGLAASEELLRAGILLLVQAYWLRGLDQPTERILQRASEIFESYRFGDEFVPYVEN